MPYVSVDITDAAAVEKAITEAGVDGVVHCAAWTAVDAAEDEDKQENVRLRQRSWHREHCKGLQKAWTSK